MRVSALDGLRGLAIIEVLITHHGITLPATVAGQLIARLATAGSTGVDLFFVLSGYLITQGLLSAKGKPLYFRGFYWRRFLRILPLAYAVLAVLLLVMPAVTDGQQWAYFSFLANWIQGLSGHPPGYGFSVFWSLAIEEQFYLVWPLLVLVVPRHGLAYVAAATFVGTLLARVTAALMGMSAFSIYVLTPFRLDGLALGALIAIVGPPAFAKFAGYLALATGSLLVGVFVIAGEIPLTAQWFQPLGFSIIALFYGALLIMCLTRSGVASVFESRPLTIFGTYSYCLYLVHDPLRIPVQLALGANAPIGAQFSVWVAAALGLSWASWRWLEKPLLRLKTRVPFAGDREWPIGSTVYTRVRLLCYCGCRWDGTVRIGHTLIRGSCLARVLPVRGRGMVCRARPPARRAPAAQ
jgi:peptidoglycan/LPS O-acetylase OafA/YrhL